LEEHFLDQPSVAMNPYAPPQVEIDPDSLAWGARESLARPATRFKAKFIDQFLLVALVLLGLFSSAWVGGVTAVVGSAVLGSGFCIYQWFLIATTGRSLGKRWCNIKIVMMDGQPVNLMSGVVLRSWLPGALSLVPGFGSVFGLLDGGFVLRAERRCLHDYMAGTKVIDSR
jgi:uncharacterized RDD family membrane protein YckC